jgi:hypothetical protein
MRSSISQVTILLLTSRLFQIIYNILRLLLSKFLGRLYNYEETKQQKEAV